MVGESLQARVEVIILQGGPLKVRSKVISWQEELLKAECQKQQKLNIEWKRLIDSLVCK
jgi:hypothetical protein